MGAPKSGKTAKKRQEDRLGHRTLAEKSQTEIVTVDASEVLPATFSGEPDPRWSPLGLSFWDALQSTPLKRFDEATDVAFHRAFCSLTSKLERENWGSPGLVMAWHSMAKDLGVTEIMRRAASIEIQRREAAVIDPEKVARLDDYRSYGK